MEKRGKFRCVMYRYNSLINAINMYDKYILIKRVKFFFFFLKDTYLASKRAKVNHAITNFSS